MTLYSRPGNDLSRGLVGYWKLNDLKSDVANTTAIDISKFNDMTISDGINGTDINGTLGNALEFNGTSTDVVLNNNGTYINENSTWSYWAVSDDVTALKYIMAYGVDGTDRYLFGHNASDVFGFDDINDSGASQTFTPGTILTNDIWFHVAIVFNSDGKKTAFLNGVEQITFSTATSMSDIGANPELKFGQTIAGSLWYAGSMQKMRIYNRALTGGEISKLYRLRE